MRSLLSELRHFTPVACSQLVCSEAFLLTACIFVAVPAACADRLLLTTNSAKHDSSATRWNELVRKALPLLGEPNVSLLRRARAEAEQFPQPDVRLAGTLRKIATESGIDFLGPKDDNMKMLERAVDICRKCDRRTNNYLPICLFDLSREYYGHGRYNDARNVLEEALPMFTRLEGTISLNVARTKEELGYTYAKLGKQDAAKSMFIEAGRAYYQMEPNADFDIDRCVGEASVCLMLGRKITAVDQGFLEDCMRVHKQFGYQERADDFVRLGAIYLNEHKTALAREKFKYAIELFRNNQPSCAGHHLADVAYPFSGYMSFGTFMSNLFSSSTYLGEYVDDPATQSLAEKLLKRTETP